MMRVNDGFRVFKMMDLNANGQENVMVKHRESISAGGLLHKSRL